MKRHRVLILGASGMLGSSIYRYFQKRDNFDVIGAIRGNKALQIMKSQGCREFINIIDALDEELIEDQISKIKPRFIINCIGIIKQSEASKRSIETIRINSLFPHILANLCTKYNSKLIHFSTDCVFDGTNGGYVESDLVNAVDLYGRSKALGEVDYSNHLTIRTSIIGHELCSNLSLIDWFLSQEDTVLGYKNAFFSGLTTVYLAELLHDEILESNIEGLYHLSSAKISKLELLKKIKEIYKKEINIEKSSEIKIVRSLDSNKIRKKLGLSILDWDLQLDKMHKEYLEFF